MMISVRESDRNGDSLFHHTSRTDLFTAHRVHSSVPTSSHSTCDLQRSSAASLTYPARNRLFYVMRSRRSWLVSLKIILGVSMLFSFALLDTGPSAEVFSIEAMGNDLSRQSMGSGEHRIHSPLRQFAAGKACRR